MNNEEGRKEGKQIFKLEREEKRKRKRKKEARRNYWMGKDERGLDKKKREG